METIETDPQHNMGRNRPPVVPPVPVDDVPREKADRFGYHGDRRDCRNPPEWTTRFGPELLHEMHPKQWGGAKGDQDGDFSMRVNWPSIPVLPQAVQAAELILNGAQKGRVKGKHQQLAQPFPADQPDCDNPHRNSLR